MVNSNVNIEECPECHSKDLSYDGARAELSCKHCGLVIEDGIMDLGPEWRSFDSDQRMKRTRTGAPATNTIHDRGLTTMIDWKNQDIYGKPIPARDRLQWYRMRKLQKRMRIAGAAERNLAFALGEMDRCASKLGLPRSVREDGSIIYRKAAKAKLIRGRSIEGVVAATLYAACRSCNVPRTLDEIAEVSRVTKKEVGRTYRLLSRKLNLQYKPVSPSDYIPRFTTILELPNYVESRAIEIIQLATDIGITSGRSPTGVAAAALYIAAFLLGQRRTQKEIAQATNVTEVTVRNRYKELCEHLDITLEN